MEPTEEQKKAAEVAVAKAGADESSKTSDIMDQVNKLFGDFLGDKMPELISSAVSEQMGKLSANMKAAGSFGDGDKGFDGLEEWEQQAKFYDCVHKKDMSFFSDKKFLFNKKSLSEGVDSEGGFLVPEVISREIARIAENFGLIRTLAKNVPMTTDTFNQPTVESSVSVTWPGEKNPGTESEPVYGNRKLRTQTAVGLAVVTNELLADANRSVVGDLNELFAEAFAGEEDEQGINGVSAPFTGIMNDTDITTQVMDTGQIGFEDVTDQDLLDLQANLKDSVVKNGVYVMHRTVWAKILGMLQASQAIFAFQNNGQPILKEGMRDMGITPVGSIHGKDVYVSDKMPDFSASAVSTKFLYFGNHNKGFAFGDRQKLTMAMSDAATVNGVNMFETNQQAVRFTQRVALQIILAGAFQTLTTAAS